MRRKILIAAAVLVMLAIVATAVIYVDKYNNSKEAIIKRYSKEIESMLTLETNQKIIAIVRDDFNKDEIVDYVVLYGVEKYTSDSQTPAKDMNPKLEMYSNTGLAIVDDNKNEIVKLNLNKPATSDVDIKIVSGSSSNKYCFVSDSYSGNTSLVVAKDNTLVDVVNTTFENGLKPYNFTAKFDTENKNLLRVTLDNYGIAYLPPIVEEKTLNLEEAKINKDEYRLSYATDKFNTFTFELNKEDEVLRLVGTQNLLYQNSKTNKEENSSPEKTVGKILTTFKLINDKLEFEKVDVVM